MVHESVHAVLFKQDQAKQIKIVIRNAIVVSLQYAQNQRGKRFKSSWRMVHESTLFKHDQAKQINCCDQERYPCLTAICSESAGKAFQIIMVHGA